MSEESQLEKFRRLTNQRLDPKGDITTFCKEFKNILTQFKKRLPKAIETKKELYEPFFNALGIGGDILRAKKYDISFLMEKCGDYMAKKDVREVKKDIQELKATTELTLEIQNRSNENNTISTVMYESSAPRLLTIVKVPANMFYSSVWKYDGSTYLFRRPSCLNCGFYLSTGTSNETNFQNVWFPFLRVQENEKGVDYATQERGWIHKATMIQNSGRFKDNFYKLFKQKYNIDIETEYKNTFMSFFEKFSNWWQVSISAALDTNADCMWNHDPFLLKIKILALEYDFDLNPRDDNTYFIRNNKKITRYQIVNPSSTYTRPEDINKWLSDNNALCLARD